MLVGGEIAEELGGSYELGAFVGNLVGGVAGSMLYRYAGKIPRTVKGCVDLDATIGRGGSSKSISKTDSIVDVLKQGTKSADGRNIITQVDEKTKIVFRMDTGENAHAMAKYGYTNSVNHINIEVQTLSSSGRSYTKFDYHIILDELGNAVDSFATGAWTKR